MTGSWSPSAYRAAGAAGLLGGVAWIVPLGGLGWLLPGAVPAWVVALLGVTLPAALTVGGLLGVHARYGPRMDPWTARGADALLVGLALVGVGSVVLFAALPDPGAVAVAPGADLPPLAWVGAAATGAGLVLQVGGAALLGAGLWIQDLGPQLAAGLLLAGVAPFLVGVAVGPIGVGTLGEALDALLTMVVFGLAWLAYGYHLLAVARHLEDAGDAAGSAEETA